MTPPRTTFQWCNRSSGITYYIANDSGRITGKIEAAGDGHFAAYANDQYLGHYVEQDYAQRAVETTIGVAASAPSTMSETAWMRTRLEQSPNDPT